jgi:hypothetical protein
LGENTRIFLAGGQACPSPALRSELRVEDQRRDQDEPSPLTLLCAGHGKDTMNQRET